jgi:hypothetical protein
MSDKNLIGHFHDSAERSTKPTDSVSPPYGITVVNHMPKKPIDDEPMFIGIFIFNLIASLPSITSQLSPTTFLGRNRNLLVLSSSLHRFIHSQTNNKDSNPIFITQQ